MICVDWVDVFLISSALAGGRHVFRRIVGMCSRVIIICKLCSEREKRLGRWVHGLIGGGGEVERELWTNYYCEALFFCCLMDGS